MCGACAIYDIHTWHRKD